MRLFYFDTSLNINKPPGYNNTHPWLRKNYIQKKKCHKSNDFTDMHAALRKKVFGPFLLRKNKTMLSAWREYLAFRCIT